MKDVSRQQSRIGKSCGDRRRSAVSRSSRGRSVGMAALGTGVCLPRQIFDAKPYGEILKTDEYLKFETCRYFRIAAGILNDPSPAKKALPWLENEFCE